MVAVGRAASFHFFFLFHFVAAVVPSKRPSCLETTVTKHEEKKKTKSKSSYGEAGFNVRRSLLLVQLAWEQRQQHSRQSRPTVRSRDASLELLSSFFHLSFIFSSLSL